VSGLFDASLAQSLYPTLPNVFAMTLRVKTAAGGNAQAGQTADTYGAAQTVQVRRRAATVEEIRAAGLSASDKPVWLSVLKTGAEVAFVPPDLESEITDEAGVRWTVRHVDTLVLETLYSCLCIRQW
jgi:hypothetical protein